VARLWISAADGRSASAAGVAAAGVAVSAVSCGPGDCRGAVDDSVIVHQIGSPACEPKP